MLLSPLPFEKGKKLTVVYGENGTGKSTICDAFEFLGKGKVGSLENRGLGKTNKYWPSVGKKPADVAVTLETSDGSSCRATIVKSDVVANPAASRPRVEVLRRSQILALVEAKPGDRYAAISRFIDVSGVETSEATLRQLIRDLSQKSRSRRWPACGRIRMPSLNSGNPQGSRAPIRCPGPTPNPSATRTLPMPRLRL